MRLAVISPLVAIFKVQPAEKPGIPAVAKLKPPVEFITLLCVSCSIICCCADADAVS